jgi:3-oxoacyl-[acyl-carrier protein] reductase
VVVAERNIDKGEAVAAEISAAGGEALAVLTDVSDPASVEAMAAAAERAFGGIDILINNAAIFSTLKLRPFEEIPLDEWNAVMAVNVTGVMLAARACVPAMRRGRWGRIINISSASITMGLTRYLHYTTSKAAVVGMTRSLARELGAAGITVNAILPGATITEVERDSFTGDAKAMILQRQCIQRHETPDDLAAAALFLASDGAGFITGQSLTVDGGTTHL